MNRSCGDCTLCCKLLSIQELQKPVNKWCSHCAVGKGCKIYEDRPDSCREFVCMWIQGYGGDNLKPSACKAIIWMPAGVEHIQINVEETREWRGTIIEETAYKLAQRGVHVVVIRGGKRTFFKGDGLDMPDAFAEQAIA